MELSKRMQAVADLLGCHERAADIGCDHGFVSIYLIESKKVKQCLAMDVNKGPLERAACHIQKKQLSTYVETRPSDGAKAIQFITDEHGETRLEVQAALIAGMGGRLMIKILTDSLDKFRAMEEFVLQPQSEIPGVRKFLREKGWKIAKEDMVYEDGKFYPMMKVVKQTKPAASYKNETEEPSTEDGALKSELTEADKLRLFDEYGEYLLINKHPVLWDFLQKEKKLYEEIRQNLKQQRSEKSKLRIQEIEEKLIMINHGLEWFNDEM